MAFIKTNTGDTKWSDLLPKTNKLTNPANVEILKGFDKPGCSGENIDIDLTYQVNNQGADVDFTQNSVIAGLRYYKINVTDGVGGEATALIDVSATTTPVNLDTSALDASQDWSVVIYISNDFPGAGCLCENKYQAGIASPSTNPTDTITTADLVGALAVSVNGTAVADGGSFGFGASAVGDVLTATLSITNATAGSLVTVSSITGSGDGSFSSISYTPFILDDAAANGEVKVVLDTATVGAKTFSLVIASDDAATPYNIDITTTVA